MNFSLAHLSDAALLRDLTLLAARDRATTARVLAHIAEVDARKLYVPAGFSSMREYCVRELRYSDHAARKRIHAAHVARRFPAIFGAVADGRLHLAAVVTLAAALTEENAAELIAAAAFKTQDEVQHLVATLRPRPDVPVRLEMIGAQEWLGTAGSSGAAADDSSNPCAARRIGEAGGAGPADPGAAGSANGVPGFGNPCAVRRIAPRDRVAPLSAGRYALQVTIDQQTRDDLERLRTLLGRKLAPGDVAAVLKIALRHLVETIEKRKFGAGSRPRGTRRAPRGRHVPASIRREVAERDGHQCTFVAGSGRRCQAVHDLEYDHVVPVARGGETRAANLRLRCRAHNQYAAEQAFGAGFMERKRRAARDARDAAVEAGLRLEAERRAAEVAEARRIAAACDEVVPFLRALGIRPADAERAASACRTIPDASLEERVKAALRAYGPPRGTFRGNVGATPAA